MLTLKFRKVNNDQVTLCTNHTGKMEEMISLSTSCTVNKHCIERAKDKKSICSKCFSFTMSRRFKSMNAKYIRNTELLTSSILRDDQFPIINTPIVSVKYVRLESFGDLNNETQVHNYFRFCELNPTTTFALWTKNPYYIGNAIKAGHSKPDNLIVIYSSPYMNKPAKCAIFKLMPYIDKIFTVWKKASDAEKEGFTINCGARKCATCLRCYHKETENCVNELLK